MKWGFFLLDGMHSLSNLTTRWLIYIFVIGEWDSKEMYFMVFFRVGTFICLHLFKKVPHSITKTWAVISQRHRAIFCCNISKKGNELEFRVKGSKLVRWFAKVYAPLVNINRLCKYAENTAQAHKFDYTSTIERIFIAQEFSSLRS